MPKPRLSEEERKKRDKERHRLWSSNHREQLKKKNKAWMLKNPDYHKNYYLKHKEKIKACTKEHSHKSQANRTEKYRNDEDYRSKILTRNKREYTRIKTEVFQHYSDTPPKCACCGESNFLFLSLDHIHCDGNKHRKMVGFATGVGYLYWLKHNEYPEGFQVLCYNCNLAKRNSGKKFCPVHHPEEYA